MLYISFCKYPHSKINWKIHTLAIFETSSLHTLYSYKYIWFRIDLESVLPLWMGVLITEKVTQNQGTFPSSKTAPEDGGGRGGE